MATIADSAVGAILEIPPATLNQIYKAQRAIEGLQMTSKHAAEEVSKHWGTTALDGLTKFINQVNEAKTKMGSLGDIKFNINLKDSGLSSFTQGLNQSATTIAQIAQQLAQIAPNANAAAISLGNVSEQIKKAFPYEANKNIDQLSTAIKNINDKLIDSQGGVPRRADEQYLVNLRARYQEELKILNQSDSKRQEISDKDAQRKQRELERNSEIGRRRNEQYNRDVEAERMLDNARKKAFDDYEKRIQKEEQAKQRQMEAQRQFNQALREADASRIAKAEADAQKQTTDILSRKVTLQQKITELETKQSMATAKIGPALTSKESGDLTRYTAEMSRLDSQLTGLSSKYPKMVADVNRAFDVRKIEIFTDAYNRFNEALSKSQTAKHDTAESKLNQLYADRLRIVKEITQLNNTGMLNISKGAAQPLSADQNRLLQDLQTKLAGVDREIGTIANSYRGLALKAKNAYAIEELRQAIKLQEQYEKQLAAIESRGVKSQLADYKRLTTEAKKLAQSMREYTLSGGDRSATAYTQLEQRFRTVMSERRTLEMKNIDEINAYRQQRQMAAYQADLSSFIQTEAQKRIEQQRTIDEQVAKAKIAGREYAQSFQGAMIQFYQMMTGNAKGGLALNLENIKRVLSDLQTAAGKLNILDPSDAVKAKVLEDSIKKLNEIIKKYKDVTNAKPDKPLINPQDAINAAKNARTLKELQDAYKNLKTAMSTLDPKSSLWQQANTVLGKTKEEIDKIRIAMGELQAQSKKTSNDFSQLKSQLGAVFSVAAITGYIKKMVEVRAQFELQNVALRAILQNKDEADRIFMQVQQMALQSPFTIMQLTTYTKQLAAYRIESEKLVGTTKMLADVSAGLGVDMQRLILAYGQVKAANYLRATEVRQFTEAGLNIAGELANYFSELQGKMISVGDVMEMITKRMVRFEDVEEVFKRVTSAGGLFYDMQKKQAETLSGQLQRITDAYNIMLNDIGKSNQSNISSVLTFIRTLISSWREVLAAVKSVATGFAAYLLVLKTAKLLGAGTFKELVIGAKILIADMKTATFWTNALKMAWRGVMSATGIGLIVAALTTWISYLWETREAASALNEELSRIGSESLDEMNNSIGKFIELANVVSDASKTYTEHQAAIDELKRSYGEILPEQKLQSEYIRGLNGDYKDLTDTIAQYYQAQEYQKKVEAIMSGDTFKDFSNKMKEAGEQMLENGMFDPYVTKTQVNAWVEVITKEIASGKLESSTKAIGKRMQEIFGDALNGDTRRVGGYFTDAIEDANKLTAAVEELSITTIAAKKNYQEGLVQSLTGVSDKKIAETINDITNEIVAAQERLAKNKELLADPKIMEMPQAWTNVSQAIENDTIAIERNIQKLKEHNAVLAEREGLKVAEFIEEGTDKINEQVRAYYNLNKHYQELKASGQLTADTEKELKEQMDECFNSANTLAQALGFDLNRATLDAMDSEYKLGEETKSIAQRAFPILAQKAMEAMTDVQKALLKGELGFAKFKNAINDMTGKFGFKVFDDQTKTIEQLNKQIEALAKGTALASSDIDNAEKEAQSIRDAIAKKHGIRASDLDIKRGADENLKMYASSIRKQSEEATKTYNDYLAAVEKGQKAVNGKINGYTKEEIELLKRKADAYAEYADQVYTEAEKEKKGGRQGKDPILKEWEDRLDALKRYYTAAEKARKELNVAETETQQRVSFDDLWQSLGLNNQKGLSLNDLIAKGFDPKKLQSDYVSALNQLLTLIPGEERFKELRNKIQENIASESIEIDFKIKEDTRNKVKKELDEMFTNMELSREFKKLGIPIDLTYMLGGKPVNIENIQQELARLKKEMGGAGAATEDLELVKEYEKKVTQIIVKEQQERLKSYQKYLATMYSDRAKKMISAYTNMKNIEADFYGYISTLEKEAADPTTSEERKKKIADQITTLKEQAGEAIKSVRNQLDSDLNKFEWEQFKGSEVFTTLYQDMQNMSKSGIDLLITKLTEMRNRLQSMEDIDYRAVRELTQYIEKLSDARVDMSSWGELTGLIKKARELRKQDITMESAQADLMNAEKELAKYSAQVDSITAIIDLKDQEGKEDDKIKDLTTEELALYELSKDALKDKLNEAKKNVSAQQKIVDSSKEDVDTIQKAQNALNRKIAIVNKLKENFDQVYDSVVSVADALGADTDIWGDFAKAIGDSIFSVITLALQFQLMGIAANSALGVIGWIATALQVVANLLVAIFAAHDKKLQKQIDNLQDNVDKLSRAFDKLKESIDNAFKGDALKRDSDLALKNLEEQKKATEEMMRLEQAKKKTDEEQIKKYKEELEDLDETIQELQETVIEKWGGFGSQANFASASEDFATSWLDAYKSVGDGLDALEEQWDEYVDNLISKQLMLRVIGPRMEKLLKTVDQYVSKGSEEDEHLSRNEMEALRNLKENLFSNINDEAKQLMEILGIKPGGDYILSDLQKGIQNITEPQAAAIEAYLNSMRFAVFKHTEQLDTLIASVQAQYGSGVENPIVAELKGIRTVLDSIDKRLGSVIDNRVGRGASIRIAS